MKLLRINEGFRYVELVLDRPDKRNALNSELVTELTEAFDTFGSDDNIRLIRLTGNGQVFSAGADLESLRNLQSATKQQNLDDSALLSKLFKGMYECNKPILGCINGHAIAGGCGLASLCDITVAVPQAKFGYTETRIGFVPAMVSKFLIHKIGETQARRLLLGGELIDAVTARDIGLITEVADHYNDRIDYWTDVFTHQVSPVAIMMTKKLLRTVPQLSWEDSLSHAIIVNADARMTDDCKKGIAAFLNKEQIRF